MKLIRFLAAGLLALGLIAAALGLSFFMSGVSASRPERSFEDYMRDAEIYTSERSYYKAIVSYESALEEKENDLDALTGLAETYSRKMDYDKELETRTRIKELKPDDIENRIRIIEIMILNKDYENAKAETEDVLSKYESEELRSLYEMMQVEAPEFTLSSGSYDEYQLLDTVDHGDNTIVRYTVNGEDPNETSPMWTDQLVISYPETKILAKAYSALGFPSETAELDLTITKPAEAVVSRDSYSRNDWAIRSLLDKYGGQDIYNYELAQIREVYIVGDYSPSVEPEQYIFYNNGYTEYDWFEDSIGDENLELVQYMPFLKTVVFSYQEEGDLSPLASLKYLENLSVYNCGIGDISPLAGCTSLKKLALGWNNIEDISPLASLTSLESLGLWNNSIKDISAVSGLHNLTYLDIANNKVKDISAVSGLTELTEVWINGNKIKDLSPLDACEKIGVFMQAGNPVSEYGSIKDRANQFYKTDMEQ
ncbi:MAG: leucine-rich repeat domain-containing protein [Solobacterium sp.]|nr:leucine-rich repeat domain-containing protein [Solobacterium sp.]